MADTYYDSELTGEQIDAALNAIDGVIDSSNNGKVLAIEDGKIVPKSVSEWIDPPNLETLDVTENGTYTPTGDVDGYNEVIVNVPSEGPILEHLSVTQNGTYTPGTGVDGYDQVTVNVSGGGGVLVEKSVTANGVYNASDDDADGYSKVTVNVPSGSLLRGEDPPTPNIGNIGDYYMQESFPAYTLFGIEITVLGRDSDYNFDYWGTRDIQIVFEDAGGNEVLLKDLSSKSAGWAVGSGGFTTQNEIINGSTGTYYEHSGKPAYWQIRCEIPDGYKLKSLKVWPRSDGWHDYWRTFTFSQWSSERTPIGNALVSESGLVYADWPSGQYKVFDLGSVYPKKVPTISLYYKDSSGWVLVK